MTDDLPVKKKRRRRKTRRPGGNAGAVPHASEVVFRHPSAVPQIKLAVADPYDEAAATVEIAQQRKAAADELQSVDELVHLLMPLVIPSRHMVVFEWLCKATGKTHGQMVREMLIAAVIREKPAYREAMGGGGASGKDKEALANRI